MSLNSQSPPRQQAPVVHESPVHAKKVHSSRSYQNDLVEEARLDVLHDLGSAVPQVTLQTFMDFLAPRRPDFDIDATMSALESMPDSILSASGRWKAFNQEPKDQSGGEDAVFKPMIDIFNKIVDAIIASSNSRLTTHDCSVELAQNPSSAPASADRYNATRPDGYLLLKNRLDGGIISWADIALSCEYKRKDGIDELDDDVRKCLWSMQHVMRDDPCRRATFGMTIENTTTRVWFCCRSSVVVSEPFNFIAEPKALVELFAAFAFADRRSLGFDPTIVRVPGEPTQFFITVHTNNDKTKSRRFKTKKIISSFGAEPLRGRGTRVFEAIEVDDQGREIGSVVVLKDIWIDHDREREGAILAQLYDEAVGEDKELVKKHFLTTVCHGDVRMEPDTLDDTQCLMRGLKTVPDNAFELQKKESMVPKRDGASGSQSLRATSRLHVPHPNLTYPDKTHYRIVFKEKGVTIDLVPTLPDVMKALADIVTALHILRKLGWVHRDVSIGNILWYDGGAKLADLEYAKRIGDTTSHDMRTGTMHFMSVEVAAHMFLFQFKPPQFSKVEDELKRIEEPQYIKNGPARFPFTHNHLHDLESLWWVAVWLVLYNEFRITSQSNEVALSDLQDVERQLAVARTLFPSVMENTRRRDGFQQLFPEICEGLPDFKHSICSSLDVLRRDLILHYSNVEATLPLSINLTATNDSIYDDFKRVFTFSQKREFTLAFIPNIYAVLRGRLKRSRAESTNNDTGVVTQKRR